MVLFRPSQPIKTWIESILVQLFNFHQAALIGQDSD